MSGTAFASYADMALHWGETCQNDVIEGLSMIALPESADIVATVPEPSTLALLGLGLISFGAAGSHKKRLY